MFQQHCLYPTVVNLPCKTPTELQPKEGMPLLKCPYKCKGDFEGGLHACSCRSKPICNNLIGHAFLERVVKDMIADATARLRMNNQAAVYINDEKNAWEPANLSIPIPVVPLIPERQQSQRTTSVRQNRTLLCPICSRVPSNTFSNSVCVV